MKEKKNNPKKTMDINVLEKCPAGTFGLSGVFCSCCLFLLPPAGVAAVGVRLLLDQGVPVRARARRRLAHPHPDGQGYHRRRRRRRRREDGPEDDQAAGPRRIKVFFFLIFSGKLGQARLEIMYKKNVNTL